MNGASTTDAWDVLAGRRVLMPSGCAQPISLLDNLSRARKDLEVELVAGILSGGYDFLAHAPAGLRFTTWQLTAASPGLPAQALRYMPFRYSRIFSLLGPGGRYPVDAMVVHVAPPDSSGRCSLGVGPSYAAELSQRVPVVVAVVNHQMPVTEGHTPFPLARAASVVEVDEPLAQVPATPGNETDRAVAEHVATLVDDGSTVQMGIGALGDSIPAALMGKKDLSIYGMLTDAAVPLLTSGVANGATYAPHKGSVEVGEIMGTDLLYDHVRESSTVRAVSAHYAMAAETFRAIESFVAVNSCVEVDLTGQVNAESIGARAISGPGGQLDYMEGGLLSPGGKSVIALRSQTRSGHSRIVNHLAEGAVVTTPRTSVTHVVTEHGVAEIEGCSMEERAERLASIAAPQVRSRLSHGRKHE